MTWPQPPFDFAEPRHSPLRDHHVQLEGALLERRALRSGDGGLQTGDVVPLSGTGDAGGWRHGQHRQLLLQTGCTLHHGSICGMITRANPSHFQVQNLAKYLSATYLLIRSHKFISYIVLLIASFKEH